MFVTVDAALPRPGEPPRVLEAIYKPTVGERPLDDFPDGTLARREVAAYLVSEASGWDIVPPTVLRDGPFGEGMLQAFVETDPDVDVIDWINEDDPRLRRMAAFDAAVNNTDRKGGHILPVDGGRHVYGVDHGVCFSAAPKLRTVLWGWRGQPLDADELAGLGRLRDALERRARHEPARLLSRAEVRATIRRVDALLETDASRSPPRPGRPSPGRRSDGRAAGPDGGNGWGDVAVTAEPPAAARALLESAVGPASPPGDAALADVLAGVAPSRAGRRGRPVARSGGPPPSCPRPEPAGLDRASPAGASGRARRRRATDGRRPGRELLDLARRPAARRVIPYGGGTSVVGGVTVRATERPPRSRSPWSLGRACAALDQRSGLATFGAGTTGPALEAALGAARADAWPLPPVVRALDGRWLGRGAVGRPGIDGLRPDRGALRRRTRRGAGRDAGPAAASGIGGRAGPARARPRLGGPAWHHHGRRSSAPSPRPAREAVPA